MVAAPPQPPSTVLVGMVVTAAAAEGAFRVLPVAESRMNVTNASDNARLRGRRGASWVEFVKLATEPILSMFAAVLPSA